jgi:hypothetical protein
MAETFAGIVTSLGEDYWDRTPHELGWAAAPLVAAPETIQTSIDG